MGFFSLKSIPNFCFIVDKTALGRGFNFFTQVIDKYMDVLALRVVIIIPDFGEDDIIGDDLTTINDKDL